jgi:hypothetical protein
MARIYANLIIKGVKTIEDVPEKLKSDVLALLGGAGK